VQRIFKFDTDNIFLQSAYSNAWGDYDDWKEFERQINLRGIDTDELVYETEILL